MKKIVSLLLAMLLCFTMFAGCGGETTTDSGTDNGGTAAADDDTGGSEDGDTASEDTVEIGIICTLSSTHAATNGWLMASFETAVKLINENGGVDGKTLTYSLYDPESDAATLKQRLTDIKNSGAVCAISTVGDALAPAAAQWAAENEFPVFLTSNVSTEITLGNYSDYAFNMGKNSWGFAKVLAMYCVGEQKNENFVFIGTDGAATIDAENFLIYEGQKINPDFEMLASYRINFNDTEFSNIIASATTLSPQMILQQGGGPNFVSFCQQASLFNLFEYCDVYNDLVTDASTNQPLIEGNEFPYGHTHGVFTCPFWDMESFDEDIQNFVNAWYESETAQESGYYPSDSVIIHYYIWNIIDKAIEACAEAGQDYHDPKVMTEAISNVSWTDSMGEHYFRKGIDNQWTQDMYFGTSEQSDEWPGVAICGDYITYSADEYLPTAEEMRDWGAANGYDVSRFDSLS